MKRHLRWLVPLLCGPVIFFGCMMLITAVSSRPGYDASARLGLLVVGLVGLSLIGPLVSTIFFFVGAGRVWRDWRHRSRTSTAIDRYTRSPAAELDAGWAAAVELRRRLLAREVPEAITVWDVVPQAGEVMFLDLRASYARYYGKDVGYTTQRGGFYGHPAFVLGGMAIASIGNAARRHSAEAEARTQWREWENVRVVVTNMRLVCLAGGRWLSFYYSGVTALYPDVSQRALVCEFGDTVPLMLGGASSPLVSVLTVMMTHGVEGLASHPGLLPLEVAERR